MRDVDGPTDHGWDDQELSQHQKRTQQNFHNDAVRDDEMSRS